MQNCSNHQFKSMAHTCLVLLFATANGTPTLGTGQQHAIPPFIRLELCSILCKICSSDKFSLGD